MQPPTNQRAHFQRLFHDHRPLHHARMHLAVAPSAYCKNTHEVTASTIGVHLAGSTIAAPLTGGRQ